MIKQVIIIEDNKPLGEAFKEIVNNDADFKVSAVFYDADTALEELDSLAPDIILMDIDLPGMDGVEATKIIKERSPKTDVIMITVYENSQTVFNALCAGATGYLTKNISPNDLINALHELEKGGAPMSVKIAKMVVQSFQRPAGIANPLSEREQEVLSLLADGNSYQDIGDQLFISKNTIKYHIKNIYIKLQVHSKTAAIKKASERKYI